ncbi:MAG: DUF4912 domain-containing protein [Polyangiales bacterium]
MSTDDDAPTFTDEDGDDATLPSEFATATMGHILLAQGKREEALSLFRAVLARAPSDAEALRGMALLEERTPSPPPAAAPATDDPEVYARALAVDPYTVVAYWELSDARLARRGVDLSRDALSLLVVSFSVSDDGVRRDERRVDDLHRAGELYLRELAPGASHHCAVGVFRGERFVPLCRAEGVDTPRDAPVDVIARVAAAAAVAPVDRPPHPVQPAAPTPAARPPLVAITALAPVAPPIDAPWSLASAEVFERYLQAARDALPSS